MRSSSHAAALTLLTMMQAQSACAEPKQAIEFQIPPQELSSALLQFSQASGVKTFFRADITRNIDSQGLSGRYTPRQALEKLLKNTGIQYRFTDTESVTLSSEQGSLTTDQLLAMAPGNGLIMADATVNEDNIGPVEQEDMTVSGGDWTGYNVLNASTATKTDTPIMETPVSIQVLPKELMDDQQAFTLQEVLKNAPGVQTAFGFGGPFQQAVVLRGFSTEYFTVGALSYREGVRLKAPVPISSLERIELLKGPATVLYGRAVPGGIINYIPKDPLSEPYYSVQQQFGSYNLYRTSIDATGPINESGAVRYRFNLEYADFDTSISGTSTEFIDVAPTLAWDITPDTKLEIEFQYNKQQFKPDNGVPAIGNRPARLSRKFNVGEGLETDETGTRLVDIDLTHQFNENWKMHFKGLYAEYDFDVDDSVWGAGLNESTGELSRFSFEENDDGEIGLVSLNITGKLNTFGVKHSLLIGADYYDEYTESVIAFPDNTSINIFNPVYGNALRTEFTAENSLSWPYLNKWWGIYIQDQIDVLDNLHILLGGRYDNTEAVFAVEGTKPDKYDDFSPRYGIVYQPWDWLSLYGSYSESFQTTNGRSADGKAFQPETANQFEFGFKTELLDGRLSTTLAFYELTKNNILTDNINTLDPTDSIAVGEAKSKGIELSVTGSITEKLKLIGQYAYTDTEITKDNEGNRGNRLFTPW